MTEIPAQVVGEAPIRMGAAPVDAVVLHRHMVYGSGLVHALDHVLLMHLLFVVAEGRALTVKDMWRELQAAGIRSAKNAAVLVGRDAVYESFGRLIEARFVRRIQAGGSSGSFGKVSYELYPQPAWNPDAMPPSEPWDPRDHPDFPSASPQVGPLPGTPEAVKPETVSIGISAGQTASRNAGSGYAGSGVPGSGRKRIPAGQTASGVPGSGKAFPPHPQEEVKTSSPYPHASADVVRPASPEGEEAVCLSAEDVAAAAAVLMRLPHPWTAGLRKAQKLAPDLARNAARLGWSLDDPLLVAELTRDPGGVTHYPAVLPKRVADMRLREAVVLVPVSSPAAVDDACPQHPHRRAAECEPCGASAAHEAAVDEHEADVPAASPGLLAARKAAMAARFGIGTPVPPRDPARPTPAERERARYEDEERNRAIADELPSGS
ncbi:hypothetical protein [Streptomyces sp. SID3343]|uniref:hypothetical protein n=1 Tax=Streptomyces sp. SID3343 TaxID=2690260 RepID=UPI001927FD80|nr:hypothetical protein [Streptomyces sp. SID3343]